MKLSLCMIVRDNEDTIRDCLESIRPWVDEMIVVDTGSKDRTPEIARELGASLYEFPWIDDFSAARNVSLDHANGEWLFWMDSDDTIPPHCGAMLREVADKEHAPNVFGYVVEVRCPSTGNVGIGEFTVVDHVKLIRNDPRIRFEGRIHEQVLMPIRRIGGEIEPTSIHVVHSGAEYTQEAKERKSARDLRILEKDLEERPDHPFVLFNFAMTYAELERYEEALPWVERCLRVSTPQESHVAKTYCYLASCHSSMGNDALALEACRRGREIYPDDAELLFREAMSLQSMEDYPAAVDRYRELLALSARESLHSSDPSITTYKCRFNLGVAYSLMGRFSLAELQWREVLKEQPTYLPAVRALLGAMLDAKRLTALEVLCEQLLLDEATQLSAEIYLAQLATQRGQLAKAKATYDRLIESNALQLELHEAAARFYFEHGYDQQAEISLRQLCGHGPTQGAAYHNLGALLLRQNKFAEAIQALESSLETRPESPATRELLSTANRNREQQVDRV